MAYSEYLIERIRLRLQKAGKVEEKKMMGGIVFMVNDKMCVGVDIDKKTQQDRVMVRVGKLPYEDLLQKEGTRVMDFTCKVLRGFLYLDPIAFDSDEDMDFWIAKALEFNQLL